MISVSAEEMRQLDSRTINEAGVPGEVLMERAGAGLAAAAGGLLLQYGIEDPTVLLIAGKGNNGGDVFAAARILAEHDVPVEVWLAARAEDIKGDALTHLELMNKAGISLRERPDEEDWETALHELPPTDLIVDGLLGTGARGESRGAFACAIELINDLSENALVVAVDLPSGLHPDTGKPQGQTVIADLTVTMGLPKEGLLSPFALEYVGNLHVVDIGIPDLFIDELEERPRIEWIHPAEMSAMLPRRRRTSHKGTFGHILLVGGAQGYAGAIVLAARGALRSGVGLVSVLTPQSIAASVRSCLPEAMVYEGAESSEGSLLPEAIRPWTSELGKFSAMLVGPGLTPHESSMELMNEVLSMGDLPLVIDADGLNVLGGRAALLKNSSAKMILTPHPGEMARLLGCTTAEIQEDRCSAAARCAELTGETTLLKGAGTIIAEQNRNLHVNLSGNPGMARGGTGDILGGLITGFLGQGISPFEAACLGVYIHGRAGDLAASLVGQIGMEAEDVIDEIPSALKEIKLR